MTRHPPPRGGPLEYPMADNASFVLPDPLPKTLPVLALRKGVLLPATAQSFGVGRALSRSALDAADGGLLLVAVQREPVADPMPSDLLPVATLARVVERPDAGRVVVQGLVRVRLSGFPATRPHLEASFEVLPDLWPEQVQAEGLARAFLEKVRETADLVGGRERLEPLLPLAGTPGRLADVVAGLLEAPDEWRREVHQTADPVVRVERVLAHLARLKEVLAAQKSRPAFPRRPR